MKKTARTLFTALLATMLASPMALAAEPATNNQELFKAVQQGRIGLQQAEARMAEAKAAYLDVPISRATVSLSMAKMAYDTANLMLIMNNNASEAKTWVEKGELYLKEAQLSLLPSRGAEARGMFLDAGSIPKTTAGVVALLDKLQSAHFNLILPEVFRRGYTIYDSRFTDRDPDFKGAPDIMGVLVREAHKRGMEVHPWIWTFRVKSPGYGNPVLDRLPALAARAEGKESRFLSAASPQAREFIYSLVKELDDRYEIDGLMLDYIRYDEEIPEDEISRTQFSLEYQARYGKLPTFPIPKNTALMVEWQLWREQQVNTTVQELSRMLKARHPRFPVGVAVFRGESYSRLAKMQHWRHWSNNRWVDWASPMLYTSKPEELKMWLDWETDKHTRSNLLYPVLGVHRMATPDNMVEQVGTLNEENQPGVMVFALAHFDMRLLDDLRMGPFREPATLPHRNLVRATRKTIAQAQFYLTRVFSQGDFETAATARMLHTELGSVAASLPLNESPYWQSGALVERLEGVSKLSEMAPLPAAVRKEFKHRLSYAATLIQHNQFQLNGTRFSPTSMPPIPVKGDDDGKPRD